jgi:Cytochrome oxidase complex assembly protein 1
MENEPIKKSWWSRNWIWVVPVGCLASFVACMALVVLLVLGVSGIALGTVFGAIKSSDVYQQAIQELEANPAAVQALGLPVKPGLLVTGSVQVNGSTGTADLSIPISGPNGSGTLYLVARKSAGVWEFTTLQLAVKGSAERIDLLTGR